MDINILWHTKFKRNEYNIIYKEINNIGSLLVVNPMKQSNQDVFQPSMAYQFGFHEYFKSNAN